jgi:hypothetical protein
MKCPDCGTELAPEDRSCPNCGAARPQDPPSGKGSRGKWVAVGCIGLLGFVLVMAALLGCFLLGLLFQSEQLPFAEPTSTPHPTPTWLPAPPTPAPPPARRTPAPAPTFAPAVVMPYCSALDQSPVYVHEDQPVTIYWGWVATTEEHVQDFLDTATIEVLLDGEEVMPQAQSDIAYDPKDEGYVVSWSVDVGTLTPGAHRLAYHVTWSRQISDGWSTFGPRGEQEEEQEYCEIIVE